MRFLFGLFTIGGLLFFYEFVLVKPESIGVPGSADFRAQNQGSDVDNSAEEGQNHAIVKEDNKALPLAEVFGFLKNRLETDVTLDGNAGDSKDVAPSDQTIKKIKEYLIASSQLEFFGNPVELQLALRLAEDGDLSRLIQITQDFEAKYESFQKLVPPDPLARLHQQSLELTGRFIGLLRDTRDKKLGSVEATWNSPERTAIISASQNIVQELRDLVARYNIQLPSDVLP